jgi:hypothetical protein
MIIRNSKIPKLLSIFMDIYAITLYPFIFVKDDSNKITDNHENIHLVQQRELWVVGFYILYVYEWIKNLSNGMSTFDAYMNISFEREAYGNQNNLTYLETRDRMSWKKYKTQEVV